MYYWCREPMSVGGKGKTEVIFALGLVFEDTERLAKEWEGRGARLLKPNPRDKRPHIGTHPNGSPKKSGPLHVRIPMEYQSFLIESPNFCGVPRMTFELLRMTQRLQFSMNYVDEKLREECRQHYLYKIKRMFYRCVREGQWLEPSGDVLDEQETRLLDLQSKLREQFDLARRPNLNRAPGRPPKLEADDYEWSTPRTGDSTEYGGFKFQKLTGE